MFVLAQFIKPEKIPMTHADSSTMQTILSILFVLVGALAFLMLVIGGFRYVISGGDPNKTAEAKRQIAYTLVGIIVVAIAWSMVNFVIGRV